MPARGPVAIILAPSREAVSGVSTHLDLLFRSKLAKEFELVHFQVGSEGRAEGKSGRLARILFSPVLLAVEILRRKAALVHVNTSLNGGAYWRDLAYLVIGRICGTRVVYQVHGGAPPMEFFRANRTLTAFLRWTLLLPAAIVVLGRAELEAYRSFVPRQQVLMFPNSIDCTPYADLVHESSNSAAPLRLVYIGRLAREKGLYELLQAVRLADMENGNVLLVVAGKGPDEAPLRKLVLELGLERVVSFSGPLYGKDKIRLLGASDVFVLASHGEGLPYALLESMAAGVPAIVTRVGAIPEVVLDGIHGLFVPLQDPRAIALAIARLGADRKRLARMSAACRSRIASGYAIDRLAGEFSRLYSKLCVGRRMKAPTGSWRRS